MAVDLSSGRFSMSSVWLRLLHLIWLFFSFWSKQLKDAALLQRMHVIFIRLQWSFQLVHVQLRLLRHVSWLPQDNLSFYSQKHWQVEAEQFSHLVRIKRLCIANRMLVYRSLGICTFGPSLGWAMKARWPMKTLLGRKKQSLQRGLK